MARAVNLRVCSVKVGVLHSCSSAVVVCTSTSTSVVVVQFIVYIMRVL
jgi:hypothetical protein